MTGNRVTIKQGLIEIAADTTIDEAFYAPKEHWGLPFNPLDSTMPYLVLTPEEVNEVGRQGIRVTLSGPLPGEDFLNKIAGTTTSWDLEWCSYQVVEPVPLVWTVEHIADTVNLNNLYFPLPSATCRFRLVATEPGKLPVRFPEVSITTASDPSLADIQAALADNILAKGHEKYLMQIDFKAAESAYVEIVQQAAQVFNQATGNGAPAGTYADGSTWGYMGITGYTYAHPGDVPYAKDIPGPPEAQQLRYALLDLYFIRSLWADATVSTPCSEPVVTALYPSQYEVLNALFVGAGGLWVQGHQPAIAGRPTLYERWQQFYTCLDLLRVNIRYRTSPLPVDWTLNAVKGSETPHPLDPIKGKGGSGKPTTSGNSYNAAEWVLAFGSKDWPQDIQVIRTSSGIPTLGNLIGYPAGTRWVITSDSTYYTVIVGSQRISTSANRDFNSSDNWTKGSGWTISNYQLRHNPGGGTAAAVLGSTYSSGFTVGHAYRVSFDLNQITDQWVTSEGLGLAFAGYSASGLKNIAPGTKNLTFDYVATGTGDLTFTPTSGWDGAVDNISITELTWSSVFSVPPPTVGQIFINCDYLYPLGL